MRVLGEGSHETLVPLIFQNTLPTEVNYNVHKRLRAIRSLKFRAELGVEWVSRERVDQ